MHEPFGLGPASQCLPHATRPIPVDSPSWALAWAAALLLVSPVEWGRWRDPDSAERGVASRLLSDWNLDTTPYCFLLLVAPACWFFKAPPRPRSDARPEIECEPKPRRSFDRARVQTAAAVCVIAGTAWCSNAWVADRPLGRPVAASAVAFGDLPPAYHDEYSYLFQAKTFLAGRWSFPSHADRPELFDQVHVLNEGRFASRYFPGAGAWMAPFVAAGKPYWGHRLAGALAAVGMFFAGCELGGFAVGVWAGLLTALSPGIALFGNLLLAHHPTLAGLGLFLPCMLRFMRRPCPAVSLAAGAGLAFAMLCRPMTAAGFALPFGMWMAAWLWKGAVPLRTRGLSALAMGLPLALGLGLMAAQNAAVTGDWRLSPYEQYTRTYTPRHVYGFNNVVRGERNLGPKVMENYDRWAENLTPALAAKNVFRRVVASGQWTWGLVPLLMGLILLLGLTWREDGRWKVVAASVVSLHAAHVPYWFDGILHWHYVFETAPLLLMMLAGATVSLANAARADGRPALAWWWYAVLAAGAGTAYAAVDLLHLAAALGGVSLGMALAAWRGACGVRATVGAGVLATLAFSASWFHPAPLWSVGRLDAAVSEVGFSRSKYAVFRERVARAAGGRPALVLVRSDPADRHIDYVANEPSLDGPVLVGRFPTDGDLAAVARVFPERRLFVFEAASGGLRAAASAPAIFR